MKQSRVWMVPLFALPAWPLLHNFALQRMLLLPLLFGVVFYLVLAIAERALWRAYLAGAALSVAVAATLLWDIARVNEEVREVLAEMPRDGDCGPDEATLFASDSRWKLNQVSRPHYILDLYGPLGARQHIRYTRDPDGSGGAWSGVLDAEMHSREFPCRQGPAPGPGPSARTTAKPASPPSDPASSQSSPPPPPRQP